MPLADWESDPKKIRESSVRERQQQHWQEKTYAALSNQLQATLTQRDKCRRALQGPTSAAWLNTEPKASEGTLLDHCSFTLGLQWWIGVPILPPQDTGELCAQCGCCLDAFGDHAVSCRKNGITKRHTAIQDWVMAMARKAGISCTKEAALPNLERPSDILLHN